ncbi:uncharacterized protein LOC123382714 isoform X6 [Felis catus]|uniref:uncharacterized protein LOC123382714 isoform X6 n=1 Tax=Felis catus TaxID=9685 RepID=UPI001D19B90C|nr:uncharacterized protein LOC123382714 isoform X6 [Felis catus]
MKLEAKSVGSWSLLQQRAAAHRTPPQELKLVWSPHSGVEGSQSFHLLLNAAYACILLKMMTQQPELMRWWVSVHSKQACIVLAADCTYLLSFEPCPSGFSTWVELVQHLGQLARELEDLLSRWLAQMVYYFTFLQHQDGREEAASSEKK